MLDEEAYETLIGLSGARWMQSGIASVLSGVL